MGQHQRERQHADDRAPDDRPAAEPVADRSADHRAGRRRRQEDEQIDLRRLRGQMEAVHQVEDVVARQAGQVEILREDQCQQDGDGSSHLAARQRGVSDGRSAARRSGMAVALVPMSEPGQDGHASEGGEREPGEAGLAAGQDEEGGQQRAQRLAEIAADLEHRLRQSMLAAGGQPSDPRCLGVEDGGADSHQRRARQQDGVAWRERQHDQSDTR